MKAMTFRAHADQKQAGSGMVIGIPGIRTRPLRCSPTEDPDLVAGGV